MAKKLFCPSCENELLDGKFCPECGSELVDIETMNPSTRFMDELTERVASRTAEILEERQKRNGENKDIDSPETGAPAQGGASDKSGSPTEKTSAFFRRNK